MGIQLPFTQVDAFTDRPFRGNPAAVCITPEPVDEDLMQAIALEMNLSETAYCVPDEAEGTWGLRWFTPKTEVDLCGHATLATAHVLATDHGARGEQLFKTRSGVLRATVDDDGLVSLDFPADNVEEVDPPPGLEAAVGFSPLATGRGSTDWLAQAADAGAVRSSCPDLAGIAALGGRALIITARSDRQGYSIVSRVFAPNVGIDEDPVTGSAHTTLATWWAPRLGRSSLRAEQASARGGEVAVELAPPRVHLTGSAVTVARGVIQT